MTSTSPALGIALGESGAFTTSLIWSARGCNSRQSPGTVERSYFSEQLHKSESLALPTTFTICSVEIARHPPTFAVSLNLGRDSPGGWRLRLLGQYQEGFRESASLALSYPRWSVMDRRISGGVCLRLLPSFGGKGQFLLLFDRV